jgi:5-methylcytosine-specific restriction endonuclease McrBC GTP-binding regulatory subunit McrB
MNEDESTLTLSDKVLDRANVLRFPRPGELRDIPPADSASGAHAKGYLPKSKWLGSWMRNPDDLQQTARKNAKQTIDEINNVMAELDRPFGHRMSQAMLHYAANYPGNRDNESTQKALADQVEQRILPKLGGIPIDDSTRALARLSDIVGEQLNDHELAEEINRQTRDSAGLGLFKWRGFPRSAT